MQTETLYVAYQIPKEDMDKSQDDLDTVYDQPARLALDREVDGREVIRSERLEVLEDGTKTVTLTVKIRS